MIAANAILCIIGALSAISPVAEFFERNRKVPKE